MNRYAVALCALMSAGIVHAAPVVNGGFEAGDFTGWTQFGDTDFSSVGAGNAVHSGDFGANFGSLSGPGGIFQTLATQAGATYDVSFWLRAESGTPNSFDFNWDDGALEVSLTDMPATSYQQYTVALTATGTATDLRFTFFHEPAFFYLDDVSVSERATRTVPEPAAPGLASIALAALGGAMGRRLRTRLTRRSRFE